MSGTLMERKIVRYPIVLLCMLIVATLGFRTWEKHFWPPAMITPVVTLAEPTIDFEYYTITGSTDEDLRAALDQRGPIDPVSNTVRDAYTQWRINWNWPVPQSGESVTQVEIGLIVKVILPQWEPQEDVSSELRERWQRYRLALEAHEQKHVDLVKGNYTLVAHELRRTLLTNPRASEKELNNVAMRQVMYIRDLDLEYDRLTHNGKLEGVKFP